MAKNRVEIDVIVDDKGTTKKVGLESKKAAKGLDDVGKGARTADRNLKGTAQASSNTTKNFSKMAQGTGGLVGAYATLAAQLFAVSAAFNFLKRAGELKVLKEGQIAYASATGVAMRSLTNNIIEATDAQITFQDAAQAAAIGTAAGLSPDQLTRLGKAAKDASAILGRDVTDSFNRLVRGVTKAEPELLDELGIILRLKDATEDYARVLDKTPESLSTFEKSQAVTLDVLEQAENKYGKILEIIDVSTNKYAKLGKAFDDIVNKIREIAERTAGPLADLLTNAPAAAFGAIAILMRPVLAVALPGLANLTAHTDRFAERSKIAFNSAQQELNNYNKALIAAAKDPAARKALGEQARAGLLGGLKGVPGTQGSVLARLREGEELSNRQLGALKRQLNAQKGEYSKFNTAQRKQMLNHLDNLMLANSSATKKMTADYEKMQRGASAQFLKLKQKGAGAINSLAKISTTAIRRIGMAFNLLGIASMVISIGLLIKGFFDQGEATEDVAEKTDLLGEKFRETNEDLKHFVRIQEELNREGKATEATISAIGKSLANLTVTAYGEGLATYGGSISGFLRLQKLQAEQAAGTGAFEDIGLFSFGKEERDYRKAQRLAEQELKSLEELYGDDTGLQAYVERLQGIKEALNLSTNEQIRNSKEAKNLLSVIDDVLAGKDVEATALENAVRGYRALGTTIDSVTKAREENAKHAKSVRDSLFPISTIEKYVKSLNIELEAERRIQASDAISAEESKERIAQLEKEISFMKELNEQKLRQEAEKRGLAVAQLAARPLVEFPALQKQRGELEAIEKIQQNLAHLEDQKRLKEQAFAEIDTPSAAQLAEMQKINDEILKQEVLLKNAKYEMSDIGKITNSLTTSFETGLTNALQGVITGTTSLKDAFLNMTKLILQELAKVIAQMMALKILQSATGFFGGSGSTVPAGMTDYSSGLNVGAFARTGGVFSEGKKVQGYSAGGVAKGSTAGYPAILHGTEAVVPLPNGRSIPVEMKNGGTTQNNVVVNVSTDGTTQTQESSGMESERLGKAVAAAVQAELQNQKRSGGILNPYGAA